MSEQIYKLFETAKIVISAASGTLVEAASLGIPVISIKNPRRFDFDNSLPEYGKGMIWEEAGSPEELLDGIHKLENIMNKEPEEVKAIASKYKDMFFSEPTEESIIKAFDL